MADEKDFEIGDYAGNEITDIISNQLEVLATFSELTDVKSAYDDEDVDIILVKKNAYKLIWAAQKKLFKIVRQYKPPVEPPKEQT